MKTAQKRISTEQAYFAIYKALPLQVKAKLKNMIDQDAKEEAERLALIEEIRKAPKRPFEVLMKELEDEAERAMNEKGITIADINNAVEEMNKNRTAFKNKMRATSK